MKTTLGRLMEMQTELGDLCFSNNGIQVAFADITDDFERGGLTHDSLSVEWLRQYVWTCESELAEIAELVPSLTETWSVGCQKACPVAEGRRKICEEVIDLLHFLMSLAITAAVSPQRVLVEFSCGRYDPVHGFFVKDPDEGDDLGWMFGVWNQVVETSCEINTQRLSASETRPIYGNEPECSLMWNAIGCFSRRLGQLKDALPTLSSDEERIVDRESVSSAIVAMFSSWVALAVSCGLRAKSVVEAYEEKHSRNVKRQLSGEYKGVGAEHDEAHGLVQRGSTA